MFVVTIKDGEQEKQLLWLNKKEDDFIQFLPRQFGLPIENISVTYVVNGWDEKKKAELFLSDEDKEAGVTISFSLQDGRVVLVKSWFEIVSNEDGTRENVRRQTTIKELQTKPCRSWPYASLGFTDKGEQILNFLGNFDE